VFFILDFFTVQEKDMILSYLKKEVLSVRTVCICFISYLNAVFTDKWLLCFQNVFHFRVFLLLSLITAQKLLQIIFITLEVARQCLL